MLSERKFIRLQVFNMLVESGFFDDYGDDDGWGEATEALIPYYLSSEEKQKLMDRYDKMGLPYVVQSDPMDQPDQGDVMDPPRSRRQIVRDVLSTADRLEDEYRTSDAYYLDDDLIDADPSEKTMPLSRISNMSKSDHTFPTGMIGDFEDYSDPRGQDAQLSRMDSFDDEEYEPSMDLDFTFNFDKFNDDEENSLPYLSSDEAEKEPHGQLKENPLSRGALIRKKYFGRY